MAIVSTSNNANRGVQTGTLSLAGAGNYATGGYSLPPAVFGFGNKLNWLDVSPDSGFVFEWVNATQKLKIYDTGASSGAVLSELANASSAATAVTAAPYLAVGT